MDFPVLSVLRRGYLNRSYLSTLLPDKVDVNILYCEEVRFSGMFSQTVEYALRAVAFLADRSPTACTTDQISAATKVPKPYLSKVLQNLGRFEIVRSQRGIGGGVTLVKKPEELTILEVVNAVEPIVRIDVCPLGLKSHGKQLCPLHRRMDNAMATLEQTFKSTTLSELLSEPAGSYPLCEIHPKNPIAQGQS